MQITSETEFIMEISDLNDILISFFDCDYGKITHKTENNKNIIYIKSIDLDSNIINIIRFI